MFRAALKLALAAFIANAVWRVSSEYITEFKFRDAVREAAIYEGRGDVDLRQRIAAIAERFDLPIDDDALKIERRDSHIDIEGVYEKPIELVPGYPYPWRFAWTVDAALVQPKANGGDDLKGLVDGR
jgi:hypothetical protein